MKDIPPLSRIILFKGGTGYYNLLGLLAWINLLTFIILILAKV